MPFIPKSQFQKGTVGFIPKNKPQPQVTQPRPDIVLTGTSGVESPSGKAKVRSAVKTAELNVEETFDEKQNNKIQGFVNKIILQGTPLNKITVEDIAKLGGFKEIGIENVGKLSTLLRGVKKQRFEQINESLGKGLSELISLGDRIPEGKGLYGRYFQAGLNEVDRITAGLPAKDVYESTVSSMLATIAKAFGDAGNIGEFDQKNYKPLLEQMAHPQTEVRRLARQTLQRRLSGDFGFEIKVPTPFQAKKSLEQTSKKQPDLKELSDEELLKQLGTF